MEMAAWEPTYAELREIRSVYTGYSAMPTVTRSRSQLTPQCAGVSSVIDGDPPQYSDPDEVQETCQLPDRYSRACNSQDTTPSTTESEATTASSAAIHTAQDNTLAAHEAPNTVQTPQITHPTSFSLHAGQIHIDVKVDPADTWMLVLVAIIAYAIWAIMKMTYAVAVGIISD